MIGEGIQSTNQRKHSYVQDHVEVGFFTDPSVCIGCKACEVACKEWNEVPDDGFTWSGNSYDNTGHLGASTWRHVMFLEQDRQKGNQVVGSHSLGNDDGEDPFRWVFVSDVCKHCEEAGCLEACPTGSIVRTEVGSVLVQNDVCNGCGYCVVSCPFGVIDRRPEPLPDAGGAFKCTFCYDRQKSGLVPACAKVCPTESIVFGRLDDLRARGAERVEQLQAAGYDDAQLYDPTETSVRGIHAIFFDSRRTGSVRTASETRGADDLPEVGMDICDHDRRRIHHRDTRSVRIFRMTNERPNEKRLERLRDEAWEKGVVAGRGVDVAGGPIPRKAGYYGEPVVRPPVWTWEIPLYFFTGGIAGMSAVIASSALIFHQADLARASLWLAAILGTIISPLLLIMDLGRPRLFLNMLRVFKHRSPMSIGAWVLTLFGVCIVPGLIALELDIHQVFVGPFDQLLRVTAGIFIFASAIFGTLLATYTGVLIGATAIPAWFLHRTLLPIHFGTAGLGSAAAVLELLGYRIRALNFLGFYAAAVETALLIWLSVDKHGLADRAVHEHGSGWLLRIGEILSGPLALVLRMFGLVPFAGIAFLIGALVSRFGWIAAGKVSGSDPEAVFASQRL